MLNVLTMVTALQGLPPQEVRQEADGQWYVVPLQKAAETGAPARRVDWSAYATQTVSPMRNLSITTGDAEEDPIRWVVHFPVGGTELDQADIARLRALAKESKTFRIEARADQRGSAARNRVLAQRRADSVASVLKDAGAKGVEVAVYGADRPVCNEATEACYRRNRSVVIRVKSEESQ